MTSLQYMSGQVPMQRIQPNAHAHCCVVAIYVHTHLYIYVSKCQGLIYIMRISILFTSAGRYVNDHMYPVSDIYREPYIFMLLLLM